MIIDITPKWRINKLDDLNFCLQQLVTREKDGKAGPKGSTYWSNYSFHPTAGAACEYCARLLSSEAEVAETLDAYADRYRRIGQEIVEAVNEAISAVEARKVVI